MSEKTVERHMSIALSSYETNWTGCYKLFYFSFSHWG
ncbi:MAG: hypothetical protein ACLU4J_07070 [Butyricimonas paravirosa]